MTEPRHNIRARTVLKKRTVNWPKVIVLGFMNRAEVWNRTKPSGPWWDGSRLHSWQFEKPNFWNLSQFHIDRNNATSSYWSAEWHLLRFFQPFPRRMKTPQTRVEHRVQQNLSVCWNLNFHWILGNKLRLLIYDQIKISRFFSKKSVFLKSKRKVLTLSVIKENTRKNYQRGSFLSQSGTVGDFHATIHDGYATPENHFVARDLLGVIGIISIGQVGRTRSGSDLGNI